MASEYCRPAASDGQAVRRPRLRRLLSALALVAATGLVLLAALSSLPTACGSSAAAGSSNTGVTPSPDATRPFAAASRLYQEGFDAEAKDQIVAILSASPEAPIPESVSRLVGRPEKAARVAAWARRNWLAIVVTIIVAILFVASAWKSRQKRLCIGRFEVGVDGTPVGETIAAMVQQHMAQLSGTSDNTRLQVISSAPQDIDLPAELAEASPPASALLAVTHLFKQHVYTTSGSLHPAGDRGVGMTVLFRDWRGSLKHDVTLWQADYDLNWERSKAKKGDWKWFAHAHDRQSDKTNAVSMPEHYKLVPAAAAWILSRWADEMPGQPRPFGTISWTSLALFASASSPLPQAETAAQRRQFYERALDEDPLNRGALQNLAVLEAGTFGEYAVAEQRLMTLLGLAVSDFEAAMETIGPRRRQPLLDAVDLVWLRAQYTLTNVLYGQGCCAVCAAEGCPERVHPVSHSAALRLWKDAAHHAAVLLLRSAVLMLMRAKDEGDAVRQLAQRVEPRAMALAAAATRQAGVDVGRVEATEALLVSWPVLPSTSDDLRSALVEDLKRDMTHDEIVGYLLDPVWVHGPAKFQYDLAYYYLASGQLDKARRSLRRAFAIDSSLANVAKRDPGLCLLRPLPS